MKCVICRQPDVVDGYTSVIFERGEARFEVKNVPARVCDDCGEAYVNEEVCVRLVQFAGAMEMAGEREVVIKYEEIITNS